MVLLHRPRLIVCGAIFRIPPAKGFAKPHHDGFQGGGTEES